jgi:hypothetical protein
VSKLPADHPNRAAAEFLYAAAQLDRGEEAAVLRRALGSTNPDLQLLAARWVGRIEEQKKEQER